MLLYLESHQILDWNYTTEPNEDNFTSTNQINGRVNMALWQSTWRYYSALTECLMMYSSGNKKDYESWEQQGNPGWGFENVLSYFKKSEDNRDELLSASLNNIILLEDL